MEKAVTVGSMGQLIKSSYVGMDGDGDLHLFAKNKKNIHKEK
jgi:hypothetical protein